MPGQQLTRMLTFCSRRFSVFTCIDCAQTQKRRGSKVQDDEEEEVVKYFKVKPENQVVKLGQYFSSCAPYSFR